MIVNLRVSPENAVKPQYLERLVANGLAFAVESFATVSEDVLTTKLDWKVFNFPTAREVAQRWIDSKTRKNEMLSFSYFFNIDGTFEVIDLFETGHTSMDDQAMKIPTLWDYFADQIKTLGAYGFDAHPVFSNINPSLKDIFVEAAARYTVHGLAPERVGMFGDEEQVVFMTAYNNEGLYAETLKKISEQYNGSQRQEASEGNQETGS